MSRARAVLFGKLPAHGDFVARNLAPEAKSAWDSWASQGLERARDALGEGFDAVHDGAPPWRFVDGPGRFGPAWRAGAIAPSVDSAGRRFLIMVAADELSPGEASASGEDLALAMEEVIYAGFEQGLDADGLIQAASASLPALPTPPQGEAPQLRWWTGGGPRHAPRMLQGPPDLLTALTPSSEEIGA